MQKLVAVAFSLLICGEALRFATSPDEKPADAARLMGLGKVEAELEEQDALAEQVDQGTESEDFQYEGNNEEDALENEMDEEKRSGFEPSQHLLAEWKEQSLNADASEQEMLASDGDSIENLPEVCTHSIKSSKTPKKAGSLCKDPWPKTKNCKKPYQVPSYRLGDLVTNQGGGYWNKRWTSFYFPESIGAKWMKTKKKKWTEDKKEKMTSAKALRQVIDSKDYEDFEKPGDDTLVIHFRGYDVLLDHLKSVYTKKMEFYEKMAEKAQSKGLKKVVVVTGDHRMNQQAGGLPGYGGEKWTPAQLAEATSATKDYMAKIEAVFRQKGFAVEERINWNADCDFIFMANAKYFVGSAGSFDHMVGRMVDMKHGEVLSEKKSESSL